MNYARHIVKTPDTSKKNPESNASEYLTSLEFTEINIARTKNTQFMRARFIKMYEIKAKNKFAKYSGYLEQCGTF